MSLLKPLREALKNMARAVIGTANFEYWLGSAAAECAYKLAEYEHVIQQAEVLIFETPREMFANYERTAEQVRASLDPPKTLEELQIPPTQNVQGYQLHHIVEQNPANLNKSPIEIFIEKYGSDLINSPSNLVWVPRLKHELITGYYNSLEPGDDLGRLHRQVVSAKEFAEQREAGLDAMRRFGVLK
jgi:A nuclease family of the HNH/ENDO VII superfamily with conserved AHH